MRSTNGLKKTTQDRTTQAIQRNITRRGHHCRRFTLTSSPEETLSSLTLKEKKKNKEYLQRVLNVCQQLKPLQGITMLKRAPELK